MKKNRDRIVEKVVADLDITKIHKAMKALNWQWYCTGSGQFRVPSKARIVERISQVARGVLDIPREQCGYYEGGLLCVKTKDNLTVSFVIDETQQAISRP